MFRAVRDILRRIINLIEQLFAHIFKDLLKPIGVKSAITQLIFAQRSILGYPRHAALAKSIIHMRDKIERRCVKAIDIQRLANHFDPFRRIHRRLNQALLRNTLFFGEPSKQFRGVACIRNTDSKQFTQVFTS